VDHAENCNEEAVRTILDRTTERRVLAERAAREGERRVELLDGRWLLKRYAFAGGERPVRRPWQREHAALEHLDDPRLPRSVGYATDLGPGGRIVRYLRSFVPGEPLDGFDLATAAEAGELLARLHASGVVTDDALTQNFLRAPDGRLFFLDFGKARLFPPHSPLLPAWAALEHCRFLRASLGGNLALWDEFRRAYFASAGRGRGYEAVVRGLSRLVIAQRRLRGLKT
jgi:hypothetical protein